MIFDFVLIYSILCNYKNNKQIDKISMKIVRISYNFL